jgi:hypothetical protein
MTLEQCEDLPRESLLSRLFRSLGPIGGCILLDLVDLATFGPVGLFGGFLLGAVVGWWVAALYGFSSRQRILITLAAAAYTAIPFTEPLPVASALGAIARFRERPRPPHEESYPEVEHLERG